jgi:hypothetical protein
VTVACLDCQRKDAELAQVHAALERALKGLDVAQRDIENLEVERRVQRAQMAKLKADAETDADSAPENDAAQAVFTYWRARCHPAAKSFKGKRRKAVTDRLKDGWGINDLFRAIDGAVEGARVDEHGHRWDELELICRDEGNLRRFMTYGVNYERKIDAALQAVCGGPWDWDAPVNEVEVLEAMEVIRERRRWDQVAA